MEKPSGWCRKKGQSPLGSSTSLKKSSVDPEWLRKRIRYFRLRFHIQHGNLGKIHVAARRGDVEKVRQVLLCGEGGLNDRDGKERTPLHWACALGHHEVVALLAEKKCDINLYNSKRKTALMKAVQCQEEQCVAILLEHGANLDFTDFCDDTALHYAACGQNTSIAAKLLSHHANIEARNKRWLTPLLLAIIKNRPAMVEFLVRNGANIHVTDNMKRTALMFAVSHKSSKIVRFLLERGINAFSEDIYGRTADAYAAANGHFMHCHLIFELALEQELTDPSPNSIPKSPDKYPNLKPTIEMEDSVPNKAVRVKDIQTSRSGLSAEQDFKMTADKEQERLDGSENKHPQVQKMSQEPEMNKDCSREDVSVYSGPPFMQTYEEMSIQQEKLEWKNNSKFSTDELNQRFGEICEKYNITACLEEEPLHDNSEGGADLKAIPSNLTKDIVDCVGSNVFGISVELQALPEQKEDPSLKNIFPSHSHSGSTEYACQSSSKLYLNENKLDGENDNKPDTEYVFNTSEENFYNDTENKKGRNPEVVTVEVEEHQEFDMQMTKNMIQNTSNGKLDIGHMPQSSDPKSLFDVWLTHWKKVKSVFQIKRHSTSTDTDPYKKAKQTQDMFQKPSHDNFSANKCKSMKPELENVNSSLPHSDRRSKSCLNEELQQDMQKFKSETGSLQVEFLALDKDQVQEEVDEEKNHRSNEMKISENLYDGAAAAAADNVLIQHRKNGRTDNQQFPSEENEEYDSSNPALHMMEGKKNEDEKWTSKYSVMAPMLEEADSLPGGPLQVNSDSHLGKIDQDDGRFALKQEREKRRDADMLCDKLTERSQKTEERPSADAAVSQRLEVTLRTRDAELRPARDNLNQLVEARNAIQRQLSQEQNARVLRDGIVSRHLCEKQEELEMAQKKMNDEVYDSPKKDLLRKNHMLQDEIPMLGLELDTIKSQYQEKENKYCKDIEIVEEKNGDLQKTVKWKRETSTVTMFQCSGQLSVLTAENTTLNSKLEDEKQNKERLETEVGSYHSRPVAAIQDHGQRQASKRDVDLAFQRVRHKWLYLQERVNFDFSVLEDKTEFLSQKLSKAESTNNSLEIQLCHTRDTLREVTSVLGCAQRDLSQTQCHMKEIEHLYQNKQGQVNKRIGKQESVEERLSQLQCKNSFLGQRLDDAHDKADHEATIAIQCQCCDAVRTPQDQSKKPGLLLEDGDKEFINGCRHLRGKLHQHEDENVEGEDDDITAQLEAAFSECLHLDEKNQVPQEKLLRLKTIQKKCEELEKEKKHLEQVVVNLKGHMEKNMIERGQAEQYKWEIEERVRQDMVEKFKEVNLFLQEQAASRENSEKLREDHNASVRRQMELRIKDLEFQLFKMKNSQDDSHETELVKYKQLYLEELQTRESLSNKLSIANERLAEFDTCFLWRKSNTHL